MNKQYKDYNMLKERIKGCYYDAVRNKHSMIYTIQYLTDRVFDSNEYEKLPQYLKSNLRSFSEGMRSMLDYDHIVCGYQIGNRFVKCGSKQIKRHYNTIHKNKIPCESRWEKDTTKVYYK